MPAEEPVHALIRYLPGVGVGETRRVIHSVPVDAEHVTLEALVAICGERIHPSLAEQLVELGGMPCEACGKLALTSGLAGESPALEGREHPRRIDQW